MNPKISITKVSAVTDRRYRLSSRATLGFAVFLLGLFFNANLSAQENLIGTVGLAHTDVNGRNWAYITWQAGDAESLGNQAFALYGKPGLASSTSNYVRLAIMARQQDTHVIDSLLQRGKNLGDDLNILDNDLNQLFGELIPSMSLSTADKLSAILRGTTGGDLTYRNLNLLSRLHPGVALTLGVAAAEMFPSGITNMTYEVRQWDLVANTDRAVIGRVTVVAGQPLMLPSPGLAVELPDDSGSGHLNIKLRWAVPDSLRRLGIATHGFNVWRFSKTRAESLGYNVTPPSAAQILAAAATYPNEVQRINDLPVVIPKVFTTNNVADFSTNGDSKTFFITDNNHVALGSPPMVSGQKFYYFVTARDLLGRDGVPSSGKLLTACDRIPPQAPRHLRARTTHSYTGGAADDGILLEWQKPPGIYPKPLSYFLYRYDSLMELKETADDPFTNRIAGPLNFPGATNLLSYIDHPCTNTVFQTNESFWYVVRAFETNDCGTNISDHSGAAWGACRDWQGPGAINGFFETTCYQPFVDCFSSTTTADYPPHQNTCHCILTCIRTNSLIEWAEFVFNCSGQRTTNRLAFGSKSDTVTANVFIPAGSCHVRCRVGTIGGAVALSGDCGNPDCQDTNKTTFVFHAGVTPGPNVINGQNTNADCTTFFVRQPYPNPDPGSNSGTNTGIKITLTLPFGTKEYRLYRSVDGGPRGLVSDSTNVMGAVSITDDAMPANSATICYYAQALDENGNPGPLQLIEPCIDVTGSIGEPQLSPIAGTALSISGSIMYLKWFCPTPGVDHFEVLISNGDDINSTSLTKPLVPIPLTIGSDGAEENYTIWRTPRVGALFGTNDNFAIYVNTAVGREHSVYIRAIDIHGNAGPLSNLEKFKGGLEKIILQPKVAWPARELPAISTRHFTPALSLIDTNLTCFDGVGVVVGTLTLCNYDCLAPSFRLNSLVWATDSDGNPPWPCVLYRQQVANAKFPNVPGDVVQVSPLIESVFTGPEMPICPDYPTLRDPYFIVNPNGDNTSQIFLKDTQPVIGGARYRYSLVRFKPNHEILEIISLGEIGVSP
jgi:hypothetical protein